MKRARIEDDPAQEVMEEECDDLRDEIIEIPNAAVSRPPAQGPLRRQPIGASLRSAPHRLEYWQERFPGFPDYVNEAFAAKTRGPAAYEEFLSSIETPGIATEIQRELENGEIVSEPRIVTWF